MIPETDFAYLAGILDGEGCFSIFRGGKRPRIDYTGRLYVVSTDRVLIDWLYDRFGGHRYSRKTRQGWKTKFEWVIDRRAATNICVSVLPYLVIKREQAFLLTEFNRSFETRFSRLPDSVREFRETCFLRMKELNHRND